MGPRIRQASFGPQWRPLPWWLTSSRANRREIEKVGRHMREARVEFDRSLKSGW